MPSNENEPDPKSASERSFDVLVAEHRPMLLNYLTGILGESHLAEDLTQESFLAAYRSLEQFDPGKGCFAAWLRGIARHKVRENARAKSRRPLVVDSRIVDGMEEIYTLFDVPYGLFDRLEIVRTCVSKLKEKLRAAIECVYRRNCSLTEAATELSTTAAAVGQRLTRARRLIRKCVEQNIKNAKPKAGPYG